MQIISRDDIPNVITLRETTHKATKTHTCSCCSREIAAGEPYKLVVYTVDGEFKTVKRCRRGRYC
jgi:hypothetical protein